MKNIKLLYILLKYYFYCFMYRNVKHIKWYSLEYKMTGHDKVWIENHTYMTVLLHRLSFLFKQVQYFKIKEL